MSATAISDYALLSDRHGAALVSADGSVDWLCLPRFDSPSVFCALLDDDAGHWSVRPAGAFTASRRYVDATMVLETTFETRTGTLRLVDALATGHSEDVHRLGAGAPRLLVRSVRCTAGTVDVDLVFRPRPDYGLVTPLLALEPGGVRVEGGGEVLTLSTPVPVTIDDGAATATVRMRAGEAVRFGLHRSWPDGPAPRFWSGTELAGALGSTLAAWAAWSAEHQSYEGPWRDLVWHSGRVLQALTYEPTGAIVAAATTSLPEAVGGRRNWDYRYTWVRDASMTMSALWVAACPDEAAEFFAFMADAAATFPQDPLQIMFGVGGERELPERELPHLSGWRDSRPVRVGNDASKQSQVDVYGELLDSARLFTEILGDVDPRMSQFLTALADAAARVWREPDHGIWEVRGERRHFTYSKLMCWVALDRAVGLADALDGDAEAWARTRDEIAESILDEAWNDDVGAFTQSFGSRDLDASALVIPIAGLLPGDDPRVLATISAVADRLTDERGLVHRYRTDGVDGLAGEEGSFLLCTFWLAQAQALAGMLDDAYATFERAATYVNDVGLLAEEVDAASGALLGNFPQAFSHIGLVNAAWTINQQEQGGIR